MPILETVGPLPNRPRPRQVATPSGESAALRKHGRLPAPSLEWNAEVERETAHLYERVKNVVPAVEWPFFAPYDQGDQRAEESSATPSSWRTTTRRRRSTIASPTSSATACSSRARPPRSTPT